MQVTIKPMQTLAVLAEMLRCAERNAFRRAQQTRGHGSLDNGGAEAGAALYKVAEDLDEADPQKVKFEHDVHSLLKF